MQDSYSDSEDQLLTSNADQAPYAGEWLHLLVVSCSLPLRTQPRDGCSAHALCVTLIDELKEEIHVEVQHRVQTWRRIARPGNWCAVAGLLPAPFQHNTRVWCTSVDSHVRASLARGLRAHLYPRAWQEQHSRTRAGLFLVTRRLRSGDLVLRALTDNAEFLLVTYFSARIASLPHIPLGAVVSLHGATCLHHQGVLAMCTRTDLRIVSQETSLHADDGKDGAKQTLQLNKSCYWTDKLHEISQQFSYAEDRVEDGERPVRTIWTKDSIGRNPLCKIVPSCFDQCAENYVTLQSVTKLGNCDSQSTLEESSYLNSVPALFNNSTHAGEGFNYECQEQDTQGVGSEIPKTAALSVFQNDSNSICESLAGARPKNARRFFDESPRLYRPPRKPLRIAHKPGGEISTPAPWTESRRFRTVELEDEDPSGRGTCVSQVGVKNLEQYLWYLEMVVQFRGRFGNTLKSASLEQAVANLFAFLNPSDTDQGFLDTENADADSLESYHCLPEGILSDCFSDDHVCPLVAGGSTNFPVQLSLEAAFQDLLRPWLTRDSVSERPEPTSISEQLQNVIGVLELSPQGYWLLRQPRFDASVLQRRTFRSMGIKSRQFDSGFQSQEDSPVFTGSDFQSHQDSQMFIDSDFQSQRLTPSLTDTMCFPMESCSQSLSDSGLACLPSLLRECLLSVQADRAADSFAAVVINVEWDATMNGRLVLLPECRLVAEGGTPHITPAGLWLDSQVVQDLAHLRLTPTSLPPRLPSSSSSLCPLCLYALPDVEHCDERWDPEIDAVDTVTERWDPGASPGPWNPNKNSGASPRLWESEPMAEADPEFVASSLTARHRFVLHTIAAPSTDSNGRRSCLLLVSLLHSFLQPSAGRLAVLALVNTQLRWLPLLRISTGYTLRGCVKSVPDISGLPSFRTLFEHAALEAHVCPHEWVARLPEGMSSLHAEVVATNVLAGEGDECFAESAWLDLRADNACVLRLYLRGWGRRDPPRALLRGARLHVTGVRERTSAVGRTYLHPTPLTDIQVISLATNEAAWWATTLPPISLLGATVGILPPKCIQWAMAAARCPRCTAAKHLLACERCGLAGPSRVRLTLRLRAAPNVELIAVDDVAAFVLGYSTLGWLALTDRVSREGGALEWAGPDDELPEDRNSSLWVRRFYAACRSQPAMPLAVRCRAFKGGDSTASRFVLEARKTS